MTYEDFEAELATLGLSKKEFAEQLGVYKNYISRWKHSKNGVPNYIPLALDGIRWRQHTKEHIMNAITTDLIDAHFTRWGNSSNAVEGYLVYCWDQREEELDDLQSDDRGNAPHNIKYVLEQDHRHEELDIAEEIVSEWLESNRETLIEAIKDSMDEE